MRVFISFDDVFAVSGLYTTGGGGGGGIVVGLHLHHQNPFLCLQKIAQTYQGLILIVFHIMDFVFHTLHKFYYVK